MSKELISPEVVDRIFQNLYTSLPTYVPAFPSMLRGLIVTAVITIIGILVGYFDRKETKDSKDLVVKTRWVILTLVFLYIGIQIGDLVKDKHYMIQCLALNKQHFANVHWLKQYISALK
jgi:hypothetical protein